jgi:hypothetical protein
MHRGSMEDEDIGYVWRGFRPLTIMRSIVMGTVPSRRVSDENRDGYSGEMRSTVMSNVTVRGLPRSR